METEHGAKLKNEAGFDCDVYDTIEIVWKHQDFFEHECYIHSRVPRIIGIEGKAEIIKVPWAQENSGFTLLLMVLKFELLLLLAQIRNSLLMRRKLIVLIIGLLKQALPKFFALMTLLHIGETKNKKKTSFSLF